MDTMMDAVLSGNRAYLRRRRRKRMDTKRQQRKLQVKLKLGRSIAEAKRNEA